MIRFLRDCAEATGFIIVNGLFLVAILLGIPIIILINLARGMRFPKEVKNG
jgi:hypothetical protein